MMMFTCPFQDRRFHALTSKHHRGSADTAPNPENHLIMIILLVDDDVDVMGVWVIVLEMNVVIIGLMTFCKLVKIFLQQRWSSIIIRWWRIAFYLGSTDFSHFPLRFYFRHLHCEWDFQSLISSAPKFRSRISQHKKRFEEENWDSLRSSQLRTIHFFSWANPLKFTSSTQ